MPPSAPAPPPPPPSSSPHLWTTLLFALLTLSFLPSLTFHTLKLPYTLPTFLLSTLLRPYASRSQSPNTGTSPSPAPPTVPCAAMSSTSWPQKTITLPPASRGSYLITDSITAALPELKEFRVGLLNLFVQHTSCALALNENWDEDVREDMSDALERLVPEDDGKGEKKGGGLYRHSAEGADDMPAHIKAALIGASITIPIRDGKLATGTWQGIWYMEFRRAKHSRNVVATIQGERKRH